ncbi:GNAT family N-acetyltransferase [Paenibacillus sp. J5C_2022]|uniref:GNAT family N-acetyltransferase n=1 Tax=Paenibacillus sp. J5C2022 TaxID=2977129 RepID=UPI0021D1D52A|nr:GNAT family N-acetyltransferase [Paenibacillus sp. J5C2022]MCU6708754.1 GNAT family N-acetyltransferase [Paenibacillus sp. J5C2022]
MDKVPIRCAAMSACTLEQVLFIRNRGFEQYYSDMTTSMEKLLRSFVNNSISPEHSVIAFDADEDKPIGFVFVAIKEVNGRLLAWNGGTGIIPEYRGRGLSKQLLGEVKRVIVKANVHRAWLEVVSANKPAIAAYQSIGFDIVDNLIGMTAKEDWNPHAWAADEADGRQVLEMDPEQCSRLPFYREDAAWCGQWHVLKSRGGRGICIRNGSNEIAGYALYEMQTDRHGLVNSSTLYQLEVAPGERDKKATIQRLLLEVFSSESPDCARTVADLSCSEPLTLELLTGGGFREIYRQYLLALNL